MDPIGILVLCVILPPTAIVLWAAAFFAVREAIRELRNK
jgi:hypothetical protein